MKLSPNGPQNHLPSTNTLSLSTNGKLKCLYWVYSFSAGHNSFSTNGPIQRNDWRDNHGLWLCLSVFLDASFVTTSTYIRVLKLKRALHFFFLFYFYFFSTEGVKHKFKLTIFELPGHISGINANILVLASVQRKISNSCRQSLHSLTQGCSGSDVDTCVWVHST